MILNHPVICVGWSELCVNAFVVAPSTREASVAGLVVSVGWGPYVGITGAPSPHLVLCPGLLLSVRAACLLVLYIPSLGVSSCCVCAPSLGASLAVRPGVITRALCALGGVAGVLWLFSCILRPEELGSGALCTVVCIGLVAVGSLLLRRVWSGLLLPPF